MEEKSSPQFFPPVVPRSLCPPENLWRIQFQMAPKRKAKTHHNTVFVLPVACHTTHLPTPLKIRNFVTVKNNYRKKKSANSYRREKKKTAQNTNIPIPNTAQTGFLKTFQAKFHQHFTNFQDLFFPFFKFKSLLIYSMLVHLM